MEGVRGVFKGSCFKKVTVYFLTWCMIFNTWLPAAMALVETDMGVNSGVLGTTWGDHTIIETDHGAIINWGNFNTSGTQSVTFDQSLAGVSSTNSAVLNRITSGTSTQFDGGLIGNGRVFVVNPAGIVFGSTATINVTQLVASGLGMSDTAFQSVLASATNKMEFSGGAGNVTNNGTINATNSAYLVGVNVANNSSVICPDGLVVLAGGDSVKLGQPGSSVIVDMAADFTVDTGNTLVHSGPGIQAKNVVLAAGDIWSQALIETETFKAAAVGDVTIDGLIEADAVAASDAVATIEIIAGADVEIYDDVLAEAVGNGIDNAIAAITINAGDDVYVEDSEILAQASDGAANTATADITANDGIIVTTDGGYAEVNADATNGVDNIANVNITGKSLDVDAKYSGEVYLGAEAEHASNSNSAAVTINADSDVDIDASDYSKASVRVYSEYGHINDATVTVNAGEQVQVYADDDGRASIGVHAGEDDEYNTSTVTIVADDVSVTAEDGSDAEIYAEAYDGVDNTADIDVTANDGNVDVYASGNSLASIEAEASDAGNSNTANVAVGARGDEGVKVRAGQDGSAFIRSSARYGDTNAAETSINSEGGVQVPADVVVEAETELSFAEIGAYAEEGTINAATTQVHAGDVYVSIPGSPGEGGIWAYAEGPEAEPHVPYLGDSGNYDPVVGDLLQFLLSEYDGDYGFQDLVWIEGQGNDLAQLLIRNNGPGDSPVDPTPPGPVRPLIPPAPLPEDPTPELLGLPAPVQRVAAGLGAGDGTDSAVTFVQPKVATEAQTDTASAAYQQEGGGENPSISQAAGSGLATIPATDAQPAEEMVKSYTAAAIQGDAEAQFALGMMYANGRGVPRDDKEAVKWFRKATESFRHGSTT